VLSGLKRYPVDLSAIVSIADNGGSTGVLRDELGVLPPGDIRQCLVALAAGDDVLRRLFMYRFHEGTLSGHNFGNLFLSALEKVTGNSLSAVHEAHRILNVNGRVIPVSSVASNLFAELHDGVVVEGEHAIDNPEGMRAGIKRCFLSPSVPANPGALEAIGRADMIVMGPGDVYTSLIPALLVDGIREAIAESRAKIVYAMNLMTKRGQTDGCTARQICEVVNGVLETSRIKTVILNSATLPEELIQKYAVAGEQPVGDDLLESEMVVLRRPLLAYEAVASRPGDMLRRSLMRHDSGRLAEALMECL